MPKPSFVGFLVISAFITAVSVVPTLHEIVPGVMMPTVNCGGGPWTSTSASNYTLFLELACKGDGLCQGGIDTALTYGVETQTSIGSAIKQSGLKARFFFYIRGSNRVSNRFPLRSSVTNCLSQRRSHAAPKPSQSTASPIPRIWTSLNSLMRILTNLGSIKWT